MLVSLTTLLLLGSLILCLRAVYRLNALRVRGMSMPYRVHEPEQWRSAGHDAALTCTVGLPVAGLRCRDVAPFLHKET